MDLEQYLEKIVVFIQEQVKNAQAQGVIVGVSGGVDSAVVALLAKKAFPNNHLAVILPCFSAEEDVTDALDLVKSQNVTYQMVILDEVFTSFSKTLISEVNEDNKQLVFGNLKARLRMSTLYALAQNHKYLVLGTDNAAEWYTGYFTKYGDGGVDLLPIVHLLKQDVRAAAKILQVPEVIIKRVPTAGLWVGQSDEKEMGFTYDTLDNFLLGNKKDISAQTTAKITRLHKISQHKRDKIPQAPEWNRK